jgi:hypothetical protein
MAFFVLFSRPSDLRNTVHDTQRREGEENERRKRESAFVPIRSLFSTPHPALSLPLADPCLLLPSFFSSPHRVRPSDYHVHFARSIKYVGSREVDKVNSSGRMIAAMEDMLIRGNSEYVVRGAKAAATIYPSRQKQPAPHPWRFAYVSTRSYVPTSARRDIELTVSLSQVTVQDHQSGEVSVTAHVFSSLQTLCGT